MKKKDFINSSWCKYASKPENQKKISGRYKSWSKRVQNTGILRKAKELYEFFKSPNVSTKEKIMVGGALLYIFSPLDLMPDGIPLIGWMDDLGVASFALQYVHNKLEQTDNKQLMEGEIDGTSAEEVFLPDMENPAEFTLSGDLPGGKLSTYIEELRKVCDELKISQGESYLNSLEERLQETHLHRLAIVGRFSTGKSTLINSLLGKQLLPTASISTTKSITYLVKGPRDLLCSETSDGELLIHDNIGDILNKKDKVLTAANKITLALKDFPFDGLTIVDTPGLSDSNEDHALLTKDIISECDAIVVLMDAVYLQAASDLEFVEQLYISGNDRKHFFVINKSDRLSSPEEELAVRKMCEKELYKRGISCDKLYLVSAKKLDQGFCYFRENLFEFINSSLKSAAYRHTEAELRAYTCSLRDSCSTAIELAGMNGEKMHQLRTECQVAYSKRQKMFEKQMASLRSKFDAYVSRFFLDFGSYIERLKGEIRATINASDIKTLQNTDVISAEILQKLRAYIDREISAFADKFQHEVSSIQSEIIRELSSISFPVKVNAVDLSALSKSIIPASLLLTYFTGGLFPLMKMAIVVLIGRDALQTVINSLITTFGIARIHNRIAHSVNAQLDQCRFQLENMLQDKFEHMFTSIKNTLRENLLGNATVQLITETPSCSEKFRQIENCRNRLTNLMAN